MSIVFKGTSQKQTWSEVREDVQQVNPEFAALIDALSPDDNHWFLRATYPYGSPVMNRAVLALPNNDGDVVPITDPSIDPEIQKGIGYNIHSNPVSIVLKNTFEIFLPLEDRTIPLSGLIMPGTVFGASRVLSAANPEQPVFIWDMTAGARSVFMLPKITEEKRHKKLQKTFGVMSGLPKTLMQHWHVFRELANGYEGKEAPWQSEILYFNGAWFEHKGDPAWQEFYQYFYQAGWAGSEFWRNQPLWNLIYSLVLQEYEAKPSAYIMDTAKYLLNMGTGSATGIGPARDTLSGPWDIIQAAYQEVYEIKNHPPVIIQPQVFKLHDKEKIPVYYSLRFPNALEFKPNRRTFPSIISDLHELRALMVRYDRELSSDKFNLDTTSLHTLFENVEYTYFHNADNLHRGMQHTNGMAEDAYLRRTVDGVVHDEFPEHCLFGKGCIRLSHKKG